jgi:hypothetical protein
MEMKKLKKLVLFLEHELERLQRSDGNRNRERELEDKLEERERELRELRRRKSGSAMDDDHPMTTATTSSVYAQRSGISLVILWF